MAGKILLIVSQDRHSTEALHWALHTCKESGRSLKVVYIIDCDTTNEMQESLASGGLVGDRPGLDLSVALNKEYAERAKTVITEMEKQCRTFPTPCETKIIEGPYLDLLEKEAALPEVDILVITEKKKSFFKNIFEGGESKDVAARINCELKVYKE